VPVSNGAAHLRRCLESIRRSGLAAHDMEIVVAVSGSPDGSETFARELATTVLAGPARNAADARNYAAGHARADTYGWLRNSLKPTRARCGARPRCGLRSGLSRHGALRAASVAPHGRTRRRSR